MNRINFVALLGLLGFGLVPTDANAGFTMYVYQSGNNVLASGSGTLDTTALTLYTQGTAGTTIDSSLAYIFLGPYNNVESNGYTGISGPSSLGSAGGFTDVVSGSGDLVGVWGNLGRLYTPYNYVSGTNLSDSDSFGNTTLAGLGLTTGTYIYTWGSGPHADSLTVNIGASPVPEPASLMILGTGMAVVLSYARWRRLVAGRD